MKVLEKYVFKHYICAFLFCITLLIVLGVIGDILGFVDDIVKHGIPLASVLAFYFYLAPFAFVNMVPFACLLSAVFVFNTLSKNHEVTAIIASGLSLWKLLRPVMLVTFMLCLVTFIVNDKFVPSTMKKAEEIKHYELEQSGKDKKTAILKDLAVYGKGGQMIYAKSFVAGANTLYDVIIHQQNPAHVIVEKINARVIKWLKDGYWVGEDVIVFEVDSKGNFKGTPKVYKTRKLAIKESPEFFLNNQWDPRFMSYRQLKRHLNILNVGSPKMMKRLLVDLNYKLSFPFAALITVLVGVPFSIETGRASALIGMAKGITMGILYLPVVAISLALGKGGILPPVVAAWAGNVLFACLGIYFINKKS